jgi:hypothetical protein
MHVQSCLPENIIKLNKSKEYTLISTHLLESVLTDKRLNAQTTKLWQILFNKARFNPTLEVKLSYNYLATTLGRSARTISRYVETLANAGYLVIKHNYDKNGGQRPNTISVRVPSILIEQIEGNKDRHNKNISVNNDTSLDRTNIFSDYIETKYVNENNKVLCGTSTSSTEYNNQKTGEDDVAADIPISSNAIDTHNQKSTTINTSEVSVIQEKNPTRDNTVRGGHDTYVIHKDNKEKDINNNNNVVVTNSENFNIKNNGIALLEQQIEKLHQQFNIESELLKNIKNPVERYDQTRKIGQIDGQLNVARQKIEHTKKQIEKFQIENKQQTDINNDPQFMLKQSGDRIISIFTFKRLAKILKSYGYSGNILNCLINEIIFETRFGSLINCNKTKTSLSLDNAINIALKLVREKRWTTPVLLKEHGNKNGLS